MARFLSSSLFIIVLMLAGFVQPVFSKNAKGTQRPVLLVHGGCGVERSEVKPEDEKQYHDGLAAALTAGYSVLSKGGTALDAVEAAVRSMEDSKVFNAGAGSVFDHEGHNTLDAAIMDGKTREVGAVAGVTVVKNPIAAAKAVMKKSHHVLFVGEGANQFAREKGLEIVEPGYFYNKTRWDELQKYLNKERSEQGRKPDNESDHRYGTVGAVALDRDGNLAAATSTGGLTGKRWGRVGDSPIIGAGTFADNESCAVSCTGDGEWFIRFNVASDIAARVKYQHKSVEKAADEVIHGVLGPGRGEGGTIVLDRKGNYTMPFNTEGMFRGYIYDEVPHTFIFGKATTGSAK